MRCIVKFVTKYFSFNCGLWNLQLQMSQGYWISKGLLSLQVFAFEFFKIHYMLNHAYEHCGSCAFIDVDHSLSELNSVKR